MRTVKIAGLILAGILLVSSTAFAGGFGGGHGGGGGFGGGHMGGGHYGGHYYGGRWYGGGWYPYYGWSGYPYGIDDYGYSDAPYAYNDDQSGLYDTATNNGSVAAAQKELTKLGYYHGSVDGVIGPETEKAVRWFQSVDKLPVNGELNDQTLRALDVS
jgi:hypothetical protein